MEFLSWKLTIKKLLFVINHRELRFKEFIDIFEFKDGKLYFVENITHPLFKSVNDIVAVGKSNFFITNDHNIERYLPLQAVLDVVGACVGNIVYYSPSDVRVISEGLCFPNGINTSPDQKKIFLTETIAKTLSIFQRNVDNSLTLEKTLDLDSSVDNIEVENDRLLIGSHPNIVQFFIHSIFQTASPSQIISVNLEDYKVEDLFLDDGEKISGSSIGVTFNGKMLIGPALMGKVVLCH